MAAKSRFTASRSEQFGICAPAAERLPPPPSVSSSTCTFTLPMLRADTATPPSPVGYKTALAFTPGQAALALAGYVLLGAFGLPVFSAMRGGLAEEAPE